MEILSISQFFSSGLLGLTATLIGFILLLFWTILIMSGVEVRRPVFRAAGILCTVLTLSMLLGIYDGLSSSATRSGGLFGGWVGQRCLVAGMETFSLVLLWLAIPIGFMVATDWLFAGYIFKFLGGSVDLAGAQSSLTVAAPRLKKDTPPSRSPAPRPAPSLFPVRERSAVTENPVVEEEQETAETEETPETPESPETEAALEGRPLGGGPWRPAVEKVQEDRLVVPVLEKEEAPGDLDISEDDDLQEDRDPASAQHVPMESDDFVREEALGGSSEEAEPLPWWKQEALVQEDEVASGVATGLATEGAVGIETVEAEAPDEAVVETEEAITEPEVEPEPEVETEPEQEAEAEPEEEPQSEPEQEPEDIEASEPEPEPEPEEEASSPPETILEPEPQAEFPFEHSDEEPLPPVTVEDEGLFREAVAVVLSEQKGSIAVLQKELGLGYFAASKLLNALEDRGVIAPHAGSIARKVIVTEEEAAKIIGKETP